jgi:hypothetical protein
LLRYFDALIVCIYLEQLCFIIIHHVWAITSICHRWSCVKIVRGYNKLIRPTKSACCCFIKWSSWDSVCVYF